MSSLMIPSSVPLLLCAPRIAGLLPAHIGPPPPERPLQRESFVYTNPRLKKLASDPYDAFFTNACDLLDTALTVLTGESDELALLVAVRSFHDAIVYGPDGPDTPYLRQKKQMAARVQVIQNR